MAWLSTLPTAISTSVGSVKTLMKSYTAWVNPTGYLPTAYLYETVDTERVEYRGLTETLAKASARSATFNSDSRTYSDWTVGTTTFRGIRISGTKITAEATRANEARGWTLVVTTTITTSTTA